MRSDGSGAFFYVMAKRFFTSSLPPGYLRTSQPSDFQQQQNNFFTP
jgi:hypothetical protein